MSRSPFASPGRLACVMLAIAALAGLGMAQTKRTAAPPQKQAAGIKVTKIDIAGLRTALKPAGRPVLVNFWATWCDPCRDEFPDLVRLHAAYRDRIDFVTISLDDVADINTLVPKFLAQMRSEIPAYLLSTPDESAAIATVSKDWSGNLPLTVVLSPDGAMAYQRMGKLRFDAVAAEIDKLTGAVRPTP